MVLGGEVESHQIQKDASRGITKNVCTWQNESIESQ